MSTNLSSRSAAEIDELYERKIKVWRWSKTVTEAERHLQAVLESKGGIVEMEEEREIVA